MDTAATASFEATNCILALHFVKADEYRRTLAEIHRRLRPGAPFVMAHISFPQGSPSE